LNLTIRKEILSSFVSELSITSFTMSYILTNDVFSICELLKARYFTLTILASLAIHVHVQEENLPVLLEHGFQVLIFS